MPNPENRRVAMALNDPRQRGLFGAAWNLGYAARMADAGVEALTLSAPLGAFGIVYARTDFPQPWFDERGEGVYPLYHVVRGMAEAAGKPGLDITSSHPGAVQALAWRDDGRSVVWLANLTGRQQRVALAGSPAGQIRVARLDTERFVTATSGPDGLPRTETAGAREPVCLDAYAVARVEWGG
jgi:hypothetical protein